jgi:hypothetical protein
MKSNRITSNSLKERLKTFRETDETLKNLKDFEIANQIGWKKEKFSKALNGRSEFYMQELLHVFIEKYNAPPQFFEDDTVIMLGQLQLKYDKLEKYCRIKDEVTRKEKELLTLQMKLYRDRIQQFKELSDTEEFQEALKKEGKNDILHLILAIFAIEIDYDN